MKSILSVTTIAFIASSPLFMSACSQPDLSTNRTGLNRVGEALSDTAKYNRSIETINAFALDERRRLARLRNESPSDASRSQWVRLNPDGTHGEAIKTARTPTGSGSSLDTDYSPEILNAPKSRLQSRLIDAINRKRAEFGKKSLSPNSDLMEAAQDYARVSARKGDIEHIHTDGSTPGDRAMAAGYRWRFIAENLAAGQDSIGLTIEDWMNSPKHRDALLSSEPTEIGVGQFTDNSDPAYQQYWVMLVGTPRS